MLIYKITNKINGKLYVGLTTQKMSNRFRAHIYSAFVKREDTHCRALSSAIHKYGQENFTIECIDQASSKEDLCKKEIDWISKLNTICPNGYNITSGGENGFSRTSESIARGIQTRKERKECGLIYNKKRRPISAEVREIIAKKTRKTYVLKSPDGVIYKIKGLVGFSKELGLSRSHLSKVFAGTRKSSNGWVKPSDMELINNPNIVEWGDK